jgi:cobalt-zinc-cadmium efflux system outer membrane protein
VKRANGAGSEFHGDAELTQTFEFPGKRSLRRAVAQKSVETRRLALEGFRYQLTIRIRRVFYEALGWHEVISRRERRLELVQGFAAAARTKVDGGFAPEFEATKAEVEVIAARRALREAEASHRGAHAALNTLLGRHPDEPLEVAGELLDAVPEIDQSALEAQALARNPSLRVQRAEVERTKLSIDSVHRSRLPDFTIGPNVEYVRDEQIYGLGVSLPLPLWDRKKGEIATANAEYEKATAELVTLQHEIIRDVATAAQTLTAAQEALSYYTPELRDQLQAALDAATESYSSGRTTLLIFLETQRTYFDFQFGYFETLQSLYDARAELEAALGVPLTEAR